MTIVLKFRMIRLNDWPPQKAGCGILVGRDELLALMRVPQISVGLIHPVFARWRKDIEIDRIFLSKSFVRHVRRNNQALSGSHNNYAIIDIESQRAFQDISDLLIMVAVHGHVAALPE